MNASSFTIDESPSREDIHFLEDRIYEFNVAATHIKDGRLLAIFVRDANQQVVAGLPCATRRHLQMSRVARWQRAALLCSATRDEALLVLPDRQRTYPTRRRRASFACVGDILTCESVSRVCRPSVCGTGPYGWTWGGCLEVEYLWVRADLRRQGHGKNLLHAAEREAIARGCRQSLLNTHSFQAPEFYQKFGYQVVGVYENYPTGHKQFFLMKSLNAPPP